MDLDLELIAANLAVEKAQAALSEKEAVLAGIDAEVAELASRRAAFDALPEVKTADVVAIENARRRQRRIETEDRPPADAAVESARSALADAEREVARVQYQQARHEVERVAKAVGKAVDEAVRTVRERLAELKTLEGAASRLASACGEQPPGPTRPWSLVSPSAGCSPVLNLNGVGEHRRDRFLIDLSRAYQAHLDSLTNEERAALHPSPAAAAAEGAPEPERRGDVLASLALANLNRNAEACAADSEVRAMTARRLAEASAASAESVPDLDYNPIG